MVMIHSSWVTCMGRASGRRNTAEVSAAAGCGPRNRLPNDGQRDDDAATKEYSPRRTVCQMGGQRRKPRSRGALVRRLGWSGGILGCVGQRERDQNVDG